MAQCYSCNQAIAYFAMGINIFKHFRRNFWRRTLPIFNCPHCGVECQETAISVYTFLLLFITVVVGVLMVMHKRHIAIGNELVYIIVCLSGYFVMHYFWWRFVSQLKEPHIFWWENK